jgi:hypothetical protein
MPAGQHWSGCCRRRRRVATGGGAGQWLVLVEPAALGVWFNFGKKHLDVRDWTCTQCALTDDRDLFAARDILAEGRMVAAALAQTLHARGGGLRAGLVSAAARGSQNPPRCRASGTVGITAIQGRQDVKQLG